MDEMALQNLKTALKPLGWSEEAVVLGLKQEFRCKYCKRDLLATIEDYDVWQFDHVVPVSKQGADMMENKVVACKLCNFAKRSFDPRSNVDEHATAEQLLNAAENYVMQVREQKKERLQKVKDILLEFKLIGAERKNQKEV